MRSALPPWRTPFARRARPAGPHGPEHGLDQCARPPAGLGARVSEAAGFTLPCCPPTVSDSYSLLGRTSDAEPNQREQPRGRHGSGARARGGQRRAQLPPRVPRGLSIRAALLISDSLRLGLQRGRRISPRRPGYSGQRRAYEQPFAHENRASAPKGEQKGEIQTANLGEYQ